MGGSLHLYCLRLLSLVANCKEVTASAEMDLYQESSRMRLSPHWSMAARRRRLKGEHRRRCMQAVKPCAPQQGGSRRRMEVWTGRAFRVRKRAEVVLQLELEFQIGDTPVRYITPVKRDNIPVAVPEGDLGHAYVLTTVIRPDALFLHSYPPIDNLRSCLCIRNSMRLDLRIPALQTPQSAYDQSDSPTAPMYRPGR